jgi:hypothetical protein
MGGKRKWVAKVKGKNEVYAVYPSIRQASIENLIDVPSLRMCLKDYVPDSNGFYYRYCDNVEIWLEPLTFEQVLE